MTIRELVRLLQEYDDQDVEVLVVHQESWPLQVEVAGVWDEVFSREAHLRDCRGDGYCGPGCPDLTEGGCPDLSEDAQDAVPVYIVAGGHPYNRSPYGPGRAFQEVRTR